MKTKADKMERCKTCGGKVCICYVEGKWAAHCMTCDRVVNKKGGTTSRKIEGVPYVFDSVKEAEKYWNKWNAKKVK